MTFSHLSPEMGEKKGTKKLLRTVEIFLGTEVPG